MKKLISIVTPVYCEEECISLFHEELTNVMESLEQYDFEIIYVVDKSKDNTLGILIGIADRDARVTVIGLSRRFGHQMSLVAGMDRCAGDACIMMDSDLEHPPAFIPFLLEKFEEGFDVVHTKREYARKTGVFKASSSKLFYRFLNRLSEEDLGEDSADFRLVSRKVVEVFNRKVREHNQYLRGLFRWVGFHQTEVSFVSGTRQAGKSKYGIGKLLKLGMDGVVSFSKAPLKASIVFGIVVALIGVGYGVYNIIQYFVDTSLPEGWTTLVILVLLIGGLILFILGIIGLYISAIFDEVKNRPLYIIECLYGQSTGQNEGDFLMGRREEQNEDHVQG